MIVKRASDIPPEPEPTGPDFPIEEPATEPPPGFPGENPEPPMEPGPPYETPAEV